MNPWGGAPKDPKKGARSFLNLKSFAMKTQEQAQTFDRKSPEPKKVDPSMVLKGLKEAMGSSPEQPLKKKPKQIDSQIPPSKFLIIPLFELSQCPSLTLLTF